MKAQSSMEAATLITFLTLVVVIFLGVTTEMVSRSYQTRERQVITDLSEMIETEVRIAASSQDGYNRQFELPPNLEGKEYSVEFMGPEKLKGAPGEPDADHSELIVKYINDTYEQVVLLPRNVNGSVCVGRNVIVKDRSGINVTCNCISGYRDADGDGYTNSEKKTACFGELGAGYSSSPSPIIDCDDSNSFAWQNLTCYNDEDSDGHGIGAPSIICSGATCPLGYGSDGLDCKDNNPVAWACKKVFLTSVPRMGDFGGFGGADTTCQIYANNAGLSGNYRAWLSTSAQSAESRFTHSIAPFKYRMVDPMMTIVADDWTDLTDATIDNPINYDEYGNIVTTDIYTWTATKPDGSYDPPSCDDWTSIANNGKKGRITDTDEDWTSNNPPRDCDNLYRLYCFEQ
ncbi:hypothetical protein HYU11_00205 [Candidatus Woesearchaeota archaeon]|nr:hypothetical protein [Candidatus Woesearchaeota archaeon]